MKHALSFPIVLASFLVACSTPVKDVKTAAKQNQICKSSQANTSQAFGVKGMVCQMGCGGSIRKALKETCAVERVEVNYIDSLEEQQIKVYYDRQKIAPKQMLGILSELNDKQFTVRTIGAPQKI